MSCSYAKDFSEDIIDRLPDEIILYILSFLSLETILICERVSARWRKLSRDPSIWRNIVIRYSGKPDLIKACDIGNMNLFFSHCQYIHCIKLQYIYDYPLILSLLKNCTNLISLELVMCSISLDFQEHVSLWKKLKKLNLKNTLCIHNSSEMLFKFDDFKDLTFLALPNFGLSTHNFSSLLECKNLNHIFIEKIKCLSLDNIRQLILGRQQILICLHIYGGSSVDDNCLQILSHSPRLKDLAIVNCDNLTDEGLLSLINYKLIENIQIWNNKSFSEKALIQTLSHPNLFKLIRLSLSRINNIPPIIVDIISESYKRLKFLALYNCPRIVYREHAKHLDSKFRNIDVVLY